MQLLEWKIKTKHEHTVGRVYEIVKSSRGSTLGIVNVWCITAVVGNCEQVFCIYIYTQFLDFVLEPMVREGVAYLQTS